MTDQPQIVRTATDVQKAHDILTGVILGESPLEIDQRTKESLIIAADVLCWILGHDHNRTFQENLSGIERQIREHGWAVEDSGELRRPSEMLNEIDRIIAEES